MRRLLVAVGIGMLACGDPVRSQTLDARGGETPGVPKGPLHRPGQPCLVCHGGDGPGDSVFSLAGTVEQTEGASVPLSDALVKFIDSNGKTYETGTNCAGNFFVMTADYAPAFPVWVKLVFGKAGATAVEQVMGSPIYREGSCAYCHTRSPGTESPGPVYFAPSGVPFPAQCQE